MRASDFMALLLLSALWGGSFIFIRIGAPALGPIWLVEGRVLIAGLALVALAIASRAALNPRRRWKDYLAIGALNSAIPFILIATAELRLTASLAAILNATTPLFGALIAAVWIRESLTSRKMTGLVLGFLGVGLIVGWSPLPFSFELLLSVGASLLGALFYAIAGVYTKVRAAGLPPLALSTGSQLSAALLLLPLLPFSPPAEQPSTAVIMSVLALALLCTALGFILYFRLILNVGPTRAMTVTFLTPVFGLIWGAFLLREPVGVDTLLGCGVILLGTMLVTGVRFPFGAIPLPVRLTRERDSHG